MNYEKKGDAYVLRDGDAVVYETERPAFAYDPEAGTLLQHGPAEDVVAWCDVYYATMYEEYGRALHATVVLTGKKFDCAELDLVLRVPGYVAQMAHRIVAEETADNPLSREVQELLGGAVSQDN